MPKQSKKQLQDDEQKILQELLRDSSQNINAIADKLGFSRQKIWRVIKNLEKNHTIWGYTTIIDEGRQGFKNYILLIKRTTHPVDNQLAEKIISRGIEEQMQAMGCRMVSSIYTHGFYDWVIIFTSKDIIQAKKTSELFKARYNKYIREAILLDELFTCKIQNILNPNIGDLNTALGL
jgi:DNA-binding Lrp family transcriptional regulator